MPQAPFNAGHTRAAIRAGPAECRPILFPGLQLWGDTLLVRVRFSSRRVAR